jgi:hypothetical protein
VDLLVDLLKSLDQHKVASKRSLCFNPVEFRSQYKDKKKGAKSVGATGGIEI